MTPEKRAVALMREIGLLGADEHADGRDKDYKAIADAIRAAVAEQRERDAKIAETIEAEGNYFYNDEQGSYWESDWRKTVAEVARRIRETT